MARAWANMRRSFTGLRVCAPAFVHVMAAEVDQWRLERRLRLPGRVLTCDWSAGLRPAAVWIAAECPSAWSAAPIVLDRTICLANSPLFRQINFNSNGATRMTMNRQFDESDQILAVNKNLFGGLVAMSKVSLAKSASAFVCLIVFLTLGCSDRTSPSLMTSLKGESANRIVAIEQLDLTTSSGRPSREEVRSAKVIRRVEASTQIETFVKAIADARKGVTFANHPSAICEVVLRVETKDGTWFLFCWVMKVEGRKYCVLNLGEEGETSINRMMEYNSDVLVEWFKRNKIELNEGSRLR